MASGHGETDFVPSSKGTLFHAMQRLVFFFTNHFHEHRTIRKPTYWLVGCEPAEFFTVEVFIWHKCMSNHSTECDPIGIPLVSIFNMYTMQ